MGKERENLPKIKEISRGKKYTETYSKHFDDHRHLSQSEVSKYM
jgi:hypothetical protein